MKKQSRKNFLIVILLIILFFSFAVISPFKIHCYSATNSQTIEKEIDFSVMEELNKIDFSSLNSIVNEFNNSNTNLFSIDNIKSKVYAIISGENAVSYESFFASVFSNIIELILKYMPMLSLIIAIGVISNLLNGIKSKFNEKSTSDLIHVVCFMSVAILIIGIINNLVTSTGKSISSMVSQMNIMFPILLTLMVGLGSTASVGVFQPVVAIMSTYVADIFNLFIIPLF